jgi:hypothetical protein
MLFALTRSNLLGQLPHGNGIILRLTEQVTLSQFNLAKSGQVETCFWEPLKNEWLSTR